MCKNKMYLLYPSKQHTNIQKTNVTALKYVENKEIIFYTKTRSIDIISHKGDTYERIAQPCWSVYWI